MSWLGFLVFISKHQVCLSLTNSYRYGSYQLALKDLYSKYWFFFFSFSFSFFLVLQEVLKRKIITMEYSVQFSPSVMSDSLQPMNCSMPSIGFIWCFMFILGCKNYLWWITWMIGEGNGNPLQCSCLENARDGRASWAAVYGVSQSQIQWKWLSSNSSSWKIWNHSLLCSNFIHGSFEMLLNCHHEFVPLYQGSLKDWNWRVYTQSFIHKRLMEV